MLNTASWGSGLRQGAWALLLWVTVFDAGVTFCAAEHASPKPHNGENSRIALTQEQLLKGSVPDQPLDDTAVFAMPASAAASTEEFEGRLTLGNLEENDRFRQLADIFRIIPAGDSPWKHLPKFDYEFVQDGSYLVPVQQGLTITGSLSWNYLIGPGRIWQENSDAGYVRASFPFALIQRNQNCVHNGEMTFLFSTRKTPNVSHVYYQITQETCYPMKFDLWGMASATYSPNKVAHANELKKQHAQEIEHRMPTKPFATLAKDFPNSVIDVSAFAKAYKHPEDISTYGVVINGNNYSTACPTRSGQYAFCEDMRLPSYSIAKSVFAGIALMRLGQTYGTGVYGQLIKNFIPAKFVAGNWDTTTFNNVSDMATGNYNLDAYEADEDSPTMDTFLIDETLEAKLVDAFQFKEHYVPPGTKWIYQSSATFVLTQAMNAFLQQKRGQDADIFNLVRDDIYKPLQLTAGALTTIRTSNSPHGAPSGYYGLFLAKDDISKLGNFLNDSGGIIDNTQVLEPTRLKEALFRSSNAFETGVPILGTNSASALGAPQSGSGHAASANTRRYAHGFWGKQITTAEFPEYQCDFWISLMAGYGGNIVALLPNGVTFYIFSDGKEFPWTNALHELAKLSPMPNKSHAATRQLFSTRKTRGII